MQNTQRTTHPGSTQPGQQNGPQQDRRQQSSSLEQAVSVQEAGGSTGAMTLSGSSLAQSRPGGAGGVIRSQVARALARLRPAHHSAAAPQTPAPASHLSQSSAPPVDLSYLWSQEADRLAIYRDADLMDAESDLASAALNAWAATATSGSLFSPTRAQEGDPLGVSQVFGMRAQAAGGLLSVKVSPAGASSTDQKLAAAAQAVVDQVMADTKLPERCWTIARDTRKYGDKFMEIVVDDQMKVRRLKSLPPAEMHRMEDEYGRLQPVAFKQLRDGVDAAHFAAWQIVHLRNNRQGDEKYGRSGLRTARRIWRMLSLLEDSLVSARLKRAYQKMVHFLPVTAGATQQERQQMVQDYIRTMTATVLIDPATGRIEQRENPVGVATDFYLTVAPDDNPKTGIQSLDPTNPNLSQIQDMEYFQNLLVAGLEVPKAYLGLERDINSKATLGFQEIHFLRQAGALQNTVNEGISMVLDLALTLAGIDPSEVELSFLYGAA